MSRQPLEDGRTIDRNLTARLAGFNPLRQEIIETAADLTPVLLARERALAQAIELQLIEQDASVIRDRLLSERGRSPVAYAILTAGFVPPESSTKLGVFGKSEFGGFPPAGTAGHEGGVYAIPVNNRGDYFLALTGRLHPNEWTGEKFKDMIVAHPLRVLKELARRQREDDGVDPIFFLTYLAGESAGHGMNVGEAAIPVSDSEGANMTHPGFGPTSILEQYLGAHFQPKMGRSADIDVARIMVSIAKSKGIPLFPASVIGTPGNPEFETEEEVVHWDELVRRSSGGYSGYFAEQIFGDGAQSLVVPMHGMGISAELANMRQKFLGSEESTTERDFRVIPLCLATDAVGPGSLTVDHNKNFLAALTAAPKYMGLILDTVSQVADDSRFQKQTFGGFSLHHRFTSKQ